MSSDAKVIIIDLSSDEDEEDVFADENNCEEEWHVETEDDSSFSENDTDWIHDDATESDLDSDQNDEIRQKSDDDDDGDDKVTRVLTAGSDLKALNLKECKEYLRKHGLRLSGTKAVCVERIIEHWRIKDGSGEVVYPRSSFAINCKGDVCKGDVVLFTQKIKSGKTIGKRTVAGHVIKESYGTAKQQHTFTIEVLWCEGIKKLPPLYPLLVKGRNLYRLMTLRQRWDKEEDRVKILSEKHTRGAAARKVMSDRKIKLGYVLIDGRLQKPGQVKPRANKKDGFRHDVAASHSFAAFPNQNRSQSHNNNPMNHSFRPYAPRPPPRAPLTHAPPPRSYGHYNVPSIRPSHSHAYPTQQSQSYQRSPPPPAFYNRRPTTSNPWRGQAPFNPHAMPVTHHRRPQYQSHHQASFNSGYNYGVRGLDHHFSNMTISQRTQGETYRQSHDSRGPYNNGYNQGHMVSHRREGDTYRPNQ